MKELSVVEMQSVNGAGVAEALEGMVWGIGDGAGTGAVLGNKYSGAGFWIAGSFAQLAGTVIGGAAGALFGGVCGFLFGKETVAALCRDYRKS